MFCISYTAVLHVEHSTDVCCDVLTCCIARGAQYWCVLWCSYMLYCTWSTVLMCAVILHAVLHVEHSTDMCCDVLTCSAVILVWFSSHVFHLWWFEVFYVFKEWNLNINNNNNTLIYIAPACRMTSEALNKLDIWFTQWDIACAKTFLLMLWCVRRLGLANWWVM